jgi:hypothetical protein
MWSWIIVVILYLCSAGFFSLLGGLGSAADALEQWGRNSASTRTGRRVTSS